MPKLRGCPKCTGTGVGKYWVDYAKMMEAFTDNGLFGPDIRDLARLAEEFAVKEAPVRGGKLKAAHYRVIQPPVGYSRRVIIGNKMGYAVFVQGGTKGNGTGLIHAKPPGLMELRPQPYSYFGANDGRRFRATVHGQKGNDWLKRGMKKAFLYYFEGPGRRRAR